MCLLAFYLIIRSAVCYIGCWQCTLYQEFLTVYLNTPEQQSITEVRVLMKLREELFAIILVIRFVDSYYLTLFFSRLLCAHTHGNNAYRMLVAEPKGKVPFGRSDMA
jgi:hypothetical protein